MKNILRLPDAPKPAGAAPAAVPAQIPAKPTLADLVTEATALKTSVQAVLEQATAHYHNVLAAGAPAFNLAFATSARGAIETAFEKLNVHVQSLTARAAAPKP